MINSAYTVIKTEQIEKTAMFYEKYFGFKRTFSSDWYVSLKSGHSELAILDAKHESIPQKFRGKPTGSETILNLETDEVDERYHDFKKDGHPIHLDLRDEPWGQRHFISEDPNGIALDVIKVIPPSKEFLAQYEKQ